MFDIEKLKEINSYDNFVIKDIPSYKKGLELKKELIKIDSKYKEFIIPESYNNFYIRYFLNANNPNIIFGYGHTISNFNQFLDKNYEYKIFSYDELLLKEPKKIHYSELLNKVPFIILNIPNKESVERITDKFNIKRKFEVVTYKDYFLKIHLLEDNLSWDYCSMDYLKNIDYSLDNYTHYNYGDIDWEDIEIDNKENRIESNMIESPCVIKNVTNIDDFDLILNYFKLKRSSNWEMPLYMDSIQIYIFNNSWDFDKNNTDYTKFINSDNKFNDLIEHDFNSIKHILQHILQNRNIPDMKTLIIEGSGTKNLNVEKLEQDSKIFVKHTKFIRI